MECKEARALKPSFLSQMGMKTSSQMFCNDDVRCFNAAVSEDFPVEELLNLEFFDKEFENCGEVFEEDEEEGFNKLGSNNSSSVFSGGADDFDNLSTGNLAGEVEGLESLEWLSQFVDDSTSEAPLPWSMGNFTAKTVTFIGASVNAPPQEKQATFLPLPVPRKRRNKRQRSNGLPWSSMSPPLSSVGSTSASSSSSHASPSLPTLVFSIIPHDPEWFSSVEKPPPAKKPKRKPENENGVVSGRRCTHCQVQKTPQWRTGPLGPKTLCNACGVRFKSGRLFPEYRPACSPTFSQAVHSNSHRKVLEMRRLKETTATEF